MTNTINKLGYYSHELQSIWEDFDEYVENGESDVVVEHISRLQESIPELVDFVVQEIQVVRKTGTVPDILVEAIDEFFQKVENSQAA